MTNLYLFFLILIFLLFLYKILNLSFIKLVKAKIKFLNLFKKKYQKLFFDYENINFKIKLNNKFYYLLNQYLFTDSIKLDNNLSHTEKLNKKYKQVVFFLYNKKSKYFDYLLDKKEYSRALYKKSFNFIKINTQNKKKVLIKMDKENVLFKPVFIKNKTKKKLILFLLVDGLNLGLTSLMKNTNKEFGLNNKFNNVWSNSEWTFPFFGNLISGKYAGNHLCYKHDSIYSSYFNISTPKHQVKINVKKNIFEHFQDLDFVTGCYSPYRRINPSYGYERGINIFKYCRFYDTAQIMENIISQIEMFKNTSNLIFAHFFDTHGAIKNHIRLYESSGLPDTNYSFDKNKTYELNKFTTYMNLKNKNSILHVRDDYEEIEIKSAFKKIDDKLAFLFSYLNKLKLDDYTIFLLGDHGTKLQEYAKNSNVLSVGHNNVGFYIKDKKYGFKSKKNKFIETVDILPSLLYRYSKDRFLKYKSNFDGKNLLYSNMKKNHVISESIREPNYNIQIKMNDLISNSNFQFNDNKIGNLNIANYYSNTEKKLNPKRVQKNKLLQINKIRDNHIAKLTIKKNS